MGTPPPPYPFLGRLTGPKAAGCAAPMLPVFHKKAPPWTRKPQKFRTWTPGGCSPGLDAREEVPRSFSELDSRPLGAPGPGEPGWGAACYQLCWGRAGPSVSCCHSKDSRPASHSLRASVCRRKGSSPTPLVDSKLWAPCQPAKSFLDPLHPCLLQTLPRPFSDESGADKPFVQKVWDPDLDGASELSQPVRWPVGNPRKASMDWGRF